MLKHAPFYNYFSEIENWLYCKSVYDGNKYNGGYFQVPITNKIYGQFCNDDTLRAIKLLKIFYGRERNAFAYGNVAGLGCGYFELSASCLYLSVEDYKKGRTMYHRLFNNQPCIDVQELLSPLGDVRQYGCNRVIDVVRYRWCDNKPNACIVAFLVSYDCVNNKWDAVVHHIDREAYPYKTADEAYEDNSLMVCEFEDEVKENKTFDIDICIKYTQKVKAQNKKQAIKLAVSKMECGEQTIFVNGERV